MVTTANSFQDRAATPGSSARQDGGENPTSCNNNHPMVIQKEEPVEDNASKGPVGDTQSAGNGPDLAGLTNHVVNTLREWYVLASDSIANILEGRLMQQPSKDVWLLGKHYEVAAIEQHDSSQGWMENHPPGFVEDFSRLIWCTYRSHYPPIAPSAFTTDAGWGCMLRAGQTLLAQALQLHCFGREWGFSWESIQDEDRHRRRQYVGIVKQFFDDYSGTSVFSIHRMSSIGRKFEGKDIGQWFGPHGTATIIRKLAQEANHDLNIYTTTDGVVYLADICADEFRPTLILVTSMLGIDRVNPVYYPFIQASLTLPQSAGIAGGKPSSALYFAGFQGDELFYLDPHYTRQAVIHRNDDAYTATDLTTYSCNTPRRIPLNRLDPCMVFGYYCGTLEALVDLRSRINLLADDGMKTLMAFDNGHSPETAAAHVGDCARTSMHSETPNKSVASISKDTQSHADTVPLKLPPQSDSESSGVEVSEGSGRSIEHRSKGSEIILEGEGNSSEEDWVTDM
ncbi:Cysteine protease atg4 [Coemansia sp. RSA 1813]|nr:Cysteine protease atg4 [Coemansia sp. RSA 1646]KAJ1766084.1 Cysteine protease atg4 [Coemansia sp. RSA 1843]KAJ2085533.1 Cysteine protease atg4 [Coemansia sp. RSA 986]KAJ2210425.1 Cysteine protease atg4 [Coemansia sp. RSA 487]KAJ2562837.1 Cysteine protease atg4 [Coemansia sp. RSA 1813]